MLSRLLTHLFLFVTLATAGLADEATPEFPEGYEHWPIAVDQPCGRLHYKAYRQSNKLLTTTQWDGQLILVMLEESDQTCNDNTYPLTQVYRDGKWDIDEYPKTSCSFSYQIDYMIKVGGEEALEAITGCLNGIFEQLFSPQ